MEPEEFAAAVKKLWLGFCDYLYAFATVICHWLIILGAVALKLAHVLFVIGDTILRRGWRVVLPWIFIWLCAGLTYRITHGLPLPDVGTVVGALATLVVPVVVAIVSRSIDYRNGCANPSSVILTTINSIFNSFAPGPTIDGSPRPVAPA